MVTYVAFKILGVWEVSLQVYLEITINCKF